MFNISNSGSLPRLPYLKEIKQIRKNNGAKSAKVALAKFKEIQDPAELYNRLKQNRKYEKYSDNLEFLINPNALPFPDAFCREYADILEEEYEKMNRSWAKLFTERRHFLKDLVKKYIDFTNAHPPAENDPRHFLLAIADRINSGQMKMTPSLKGSGGAMICYEGQTALAILKSVNADPNTIDNPKGLANPLETTHCRFCANYQSSQKEALAYELSIALGFRDIVPPTILSIITSDKFFTFFNNEIVEEIFSLFPLMKDEILNRLGHPSPQRLCSLQAFIPDTFPLTMLLEKWGEIEFPELPFDDENYDQTIHFTRLLAETDGHSDNYLTTIKNNRYFLIKIDSGFSFPKGNGKVINALTSLPNAKTIISTYYVGLTLATDCEVVISLAKKFGLDDQSLQATVERIDFLQKLVQAQPNITHKEFELRLRMFSGAIFADIDAAERTEMALKPYTPQQLKKFKALNRSKYRVRNSNVASNKIAPGGISPTATPFKKITKLRRNSVIEIMKDKPEDGYRPFGSY